MVPAKVRMGRMVRKPPLPGAGSIIPRCGEHHSPVRGTSFPGAGNIIPRRREHHSPAQGKKIPPPAKTEEGT